MQTRRSFLLALGAALLAGCTHRIEPICLSDPRFTVSKGLLTIDAHCHVFNATDLQIEAFLKRVLMPESESFQSIAGILQKLSWIGAPTATLELARLIEIRDVLATCDESTFVAQEARDFERGYKIAVRQLDTAYRLASSETRTAFRTSSDVGEKIRELKAISAAEYRNRIQQGVRTTARSYSFDGALDFIIRNFQYRYINVLDYLKTYSVPSQRKFDLLVPSLVDYDWPIAKGDETRSSFLSQIKVMAEITRATGGRVHSFAPYDPFKHVAHDLGLEPVNPLSIVKQAVQSHGFIGVKIYPPMGFVPFGNSALRPDTWDVEWLPPSIKVADLGARLDGALGALYSWAAPNGVPIMGHTNRSNYPANPDGSSPFKNFTKRKYWKQALDNYPDLRLSFGHFGNTDVKNGEFPNSAKLATLMSKTPGTPGEHVFADSSYFVEVVDKTEPVKRALRKLLRETENTGNAPVASRLMYGSDWEMIVAEGRSQDDYFAAFQKIFAELDNEGEFGAGGKLSDHFFGLNAANFLGLAQGEQNRRRLNQFYSGSLMPPWMHKVDDAMV